MTCEHLHVDMWRLEAALVDVVVCEGLRGIGAVFVHRDGHFAMSHPSTVWTWDAVRSPRFSSEPCSGHPSEPLKKLRKSPSSRSSSNPAVQLNHNTQQSAPKEAKRHTQTSALNRTKKTLLKQIHFFTIWKIKCTSKNRSATMTLGQSRENTKTSSKEVIFF